MPCTVKKTYQGHVNKNYSIGGCFGTLRSMRKVVVTDENDDEFAEEQWEESDSVTFVTSASEDGDIVLWDVTTKDILQRIEGVHRGVCFWADVHGETGTLVSCGQDGRIVVFRHKDPAADKDGADGQANGHARDEQEGDGYPGESEETAVEEDGTVREAEAAQTNGHAYEEGAEGQQAEAAASVENYEDMVE